MRQAIAIVTKRRTDDGLVEFLPSVEIGRSYVVDLDSIRRNVRMFNYEHDTEHQKDTILETTTGRWLPLECLEIDLERGLSPGNVHV